MRVWRNTLQLSTNNHLSRLGVRHRFVEFDTLVTFGDFSPISDLGPSFDPLFSPFQTSIDFCTLQKKLFS